MAVYRHRHRQRPHRRRLRQPLVPRRRRRPRSPRRRRGAARHAARTARHRRRRPLRDAGLRRPAHALRHLDHRLPAGAVGRPPGRDHARDGQLRHGRGAGGRALPRRGAQRVGVLLVGRRRLVLAELRAVPAGGRGAGRGDQHRPARRARRPAHRRRWATPSARATPRELDVMRRLLDASMRAGAHGLSTGLVYPPGCFADTAEIVALCEVVAAVPRHLHLAHPRRARDDPRRRRRGDRHRPRRRRSRRGLAQRAQVGRRGEGQGPTSSSPRRRAAAGTT